jgi:hypothetical protein
MSAIVATIIDIHTNECTVQLPGKRVRAQIGTHKRTLLTRGTLVEVSVPSDSTSRHKIVKILQVQSTQYDVVVEAMVPARIRYRVSATSPEEALQKARSESPVEVQYTLPRRKPISAIIYDAGTSLIRMSCSLLDRLF